MLSSDRSSVKIGGGTITLNLARFLEPHNLVAAPGNYHSVGYAGWATCGGYGALGGSLGMGCDQILAAEIVTPSGDIVQADEETLWGLRGGGCNFGVVTELSIQVHRLERILAGTIMFKFDDAKSVLAGHKALLEDGLPTAASGNFGFFRIPGPPGVVLSMSFTWGSDDLEQGKKFLDKVRGLGKPIRDTVIESMLLCFTFRDAPLLGGQWPELSAELGVPRGPQNFLLYNHCERRLTGAQQHLHNM